MVSQYSGMVDTLAAPSAPAPRQRADRASESSPVKFERHLEDNATPEQSRASEATRSKAPEETSLRTDSRNTSAPSDKQAPADTAPQQTKAENTQQSPDGATPQSQSAAPETQTVDPEVAQPVLATETASEAPLADAGLLNIIIATSSVPSQTNEQVKAVKNADGSEGGPAPSAASSSQQSDLLAVAETKQVRGPKQSEAQSAESADTVTEVKSPSTQGLETQQPIEPAATQSATNEALDGAVKTIEQPAMASAQASAPAPTTALPTAPTGSKATIDQTSEASKQAPSQGVPGSQTPVIAENSQTNVGKPLSAEPTDANINKAPAPETIQQAVNPQVDKTGQTEQTEPTDQPAQNNAVNTQRPVDVAQAETSEIIVMTSDQVKPPVENQQLDIPTVASSNISAGPTSQSAQQAPIEEASVKITTEQATAQPATLVTNTTKNAQPQAQQTDTAIEDTPDQNGSIHPQVLKSVSKAGSTQTEIAALGNSDSTSKQPSNAPSDDQKPLVNQASINEIATTESKPAPSRAPKGEAFSKMMAQIEGMPGIKDQAMQTDQTIKVDAALPIQGETSSVRLTGMENFARTGHVPHQAAAANAQALAAQISKFAGKGETRFEIRLDPADLGKVDVRLTIGSDGQTRAHLFVEKSETLDFLMRDQRTLERSLQQGGLSLDKQGMEFSLMDKGSQGHQMAQNGEEQADQYAADNAEQSQDNELSTPSILEPQYSGNYLASNGLDLVI